MTMKKFIAIALILTLLLCLVACEPDKKDNASNTDTPSQSQQTPTQPTDPEQTPTDEVTTVTITCNGNTLEMQLADTVSATEFYNTLKEGDITISMREYGGFEMVGGLGFSLQRDDKQTTTSVGDVVLYSGNQIVIFYGSNSWAYTRLGKITNVTAQQLLDFFGSSNADVTFSTSTQQ